MSLTRYIILLTIAFLVREPGSFGQEKGKSHPGNPILTHQVSGLVVDSLGSPLTNVHVFLKSRGDSVLTQTNEDGMFVIEQLKTASFSLRVSYTGYKTHVGKYLFNDGNRLIVLDPIVLASQSHELKEVVVNGTPTIKYKKDTVEYRASDYKVLPYASVSELLKQMEGMEVGPGGKLFFHGEQVKSAKLNGREFSGGDVKNALANLPADIVEKIQIIDDFGEIAAKTGVKNKASQKTLNVTTQADKSIANIALIKGQLGTAGRYDELASLENIGGNRVLAFTGDLKKTIAGISLTDATNSSTSASGDMDFARPGKTIGSSSAISYTNDSGNGFSYVGSYNFFYDRNLLNAQTTSQTYSTSGSSFSTAGSDFDGASRVHQARVKINDEITRYDFIQIVADFDYATNGSKTKSQSDNFSNFTSGRQFFKNSIQDETNGDKSAIKFTLLYVKTFKKPRRFFSAQLGVNPSNQHQYVEKKVNYSYYKDSLNNPNSVDSASHLYSHKVVTSQTSELTIIYGEPIRPNSLIEFYSHMRNTAYSNSAGTDTVFQNDYRQDLAHLKNDFKYDFWESNIYVDYHYTTAKAELVIGAGPYWTNIKRHILEGQGRSLNNFTLALLPVFNFSYAWSKMERFDLSYTESTTEPTAQQLQPYRDNTDPNNIVIGNPAIKSIFIHNLSGSYNKYFPNQLVNVYLSVFDRLFQHDVTTSLKQDLISIGNGLFKTTNETTFLNVEGNQNIGTKYSLSKQFRQNLIKLELDGDISYSYKQAYSNSIKYGITQWHFSNKVGSRINFGEKASVTSYVGIIIEHIVANTKNAVPSTTKILIAAINGYYNLPYDFQVTSSAMKNYLSGYGTFNNKPLIVNAGLERRLLKRRNLMLTFNVFDIFNQSNFIQQEITPQAAIYTKSNTSNRYMTIGLQYNFQKWKGAPERNGIKMKRKGDGSFY